MASPDLEPLPSAPLPDSLDPPSSASGPHPPSTGGN
jgi:hypothetical protein